MITLTAATAATAATASATAATTTAATTTAATATTSAATATGTTSTTSVSATSSAGGLTGWATDLVERFGGPGAAIALENLFPPLPSEVVLPLTGFAAGRGVLTLASALFWTTLGSVVGALALYGIGVRLGRERLYALWARIPLVRVSDLERTEAWFSRHGTKAILFGRMIPVFRSLVSVPAGLTRMPLPTFIALTALGSLAWNSVLVCAGYLLGDRWELVERYAGLASRLVVVAVAVALAVWLAFLVRNRKRPESPRRHRRP
ncbi:DedA family protein [Streptomyces evansiae]|uniref:DedA family protein n=1 Tax=Streptomyces evansiae TaxID=3075535 RepID=UPI002887FFFC|nr:DedA family protein [Streptomyces sp. DSM 41859]MDT0420393.1 DedA family protein [Streptomyces sp. DSM 41859]